MSLITKIGGRESNSFVTVEEADAIISADGWYDDPTAWDELEPKAKEYRLMLAARMMALLPWKGSKVYCGQALSFPRSVQQNYVIPQEVKDVQCFIAYSVAHRGIESRPATADEADTGARVSSVSLGGLLAVSFAGNPVTTGSGLDKAIRSSQFPAYWTLANYLTQFRGGSVQNVDELGECLTTTTTVPVVVTTTTT